MSKAISKCLAVIFILINGFILWHAGVVYLVILGFGLAAGGVGLLLFLPFPIVAIAGAFFCTLDIATNMINRRTWLWMLAVVAFGWMPAIVRLHWIYEAHYGYTPFKEFVFNFLFLDMLKFW